jgi:hypothetical protein
MWKAALVGAAALAMGTVFSVAAQAQSFAVDSYESHASAQRGPAITEGQIARLKAALNLTSSQQQYWAPVESALRALARSQREENSNAGFVRRMTDRATSMASSAMHMRRLSAAAGPLIRSLDDAQKHHGMMVVRRMGFERYVAAAF